MSTLCSTGGGVADNAAMSTAAPPLKLDPDAAPETLPDRRSSSPEDSCAICLGKPENKSFTDSCCHTFCFSCLLEWSKVKAECPLCKQRFKSIVHNVRSFEDYDQYFVNNNNNASSGAAAGSAAASAAAAATSVVAFNALLVASRYGYVPIMTRGRLQSRSSHTIRRWPAMTTRHVSNRAARIAPPRVVQSLTTVAERRRIYELNLWVRLDRRRNRHVPPVQYRDNHALTHRLIPWLTRELDALLDRGPPSQVSFVVELILELVTRYTVCRPEFVEQVRPFFGERTPHFIHEFYAFMMSPHDMVTYDRCATYDSMVVAVERGTPAAHSFRDEADVIAAEEVAEDPSQPGPSGLQRGPVVLDSESDESDCFVVDVVQQREPIVIELSSGDEGDRTEVSPPAAVVAASAEAATATPSLTPRRKKAPQKRRRSWQRVYMSDSDSSSDEDLTVRVSAARRTQVTPRRGVMTVSHGCSLKLRIESFAGRYFGRGSNGGEGEEGAGGTGTTEEPCSSRQALERAARNKRAHQRRLRQRESSDEE